MPKFNF